MRKRFIPALVVGVVVLGLGAAYAQGGFTGPGTDAKGGAAPGKGQIVTAAAAKALPDDMRVTLQGVIVRALGDEKYMFKDASGEIVVDIDYKVWKGLSVGEKDKVEIFGKVDIERSGTEIDVKSIRKI